MIPLSFCRLLFSLTHACWRSHTRTGQSVELLLFEEPPRSEGVGEIQGEDDVWGCAAHADGDGRLDEQSPA